MKRYTVSQTVELDAPSAQLAVEMAAIAMRGADVRHFRITEGTVGSTFWAVGPDGAATREA